jgi:hypothetical protein
LLLSKVGDFKASSRRASGNAMDREAADLRDTEATKIAVGGMSLAQRRRGVEALSFNAVGVIDQLLSLQSFPLHPDSSGLGGRRSRALLLRQ